MIVGIFHQGSGLGNQLHRYVMTRVLAKDKGYQFGMVNPDNFKGRSFMNLDMGGVVDLEEGYNQFFEKKVVEDGVDIRGYDPEVNFVQDRTVIDGEFQDERYFSHRLPEVREWLKVEPLDMDDNVCVINFRGGEYKLYPDLYLPYKYWDTAIHSIIAAHSPMRFEVHTDDVGAATDMFRPYLELFGKGGLFKIVNNDIGLNWRSIRYARHLILSNSSFAILPALLNTDVSEVIAPRYWARRNTGVWALPQNYYNKFTYI